MDWDHNERSPPFYEGLKIPALYLGLGLSVAIVSGVVIGALGLDGELVDMH